MSEIKNICKQVPIIPVLVIDDISKAKPLAKTLIEAGLNVALGNAYRLHHRTWRIYKN